MKSKREHRCIRNYISRVPGLATCHGAGLVDFSFAHTKRWINKTTTGVEVSQFFHSRPCEISAEMERRRDVWDVWINTNLHFYFCSLNT